MNFHKYLNYNPETGVFTWLINTSRIVKGTCAGSVNQGYVRIKIQRKTYAAHRLAWFMTYGHWPKHELDHVNNIRSDNRLCNLREADRSENSRNCVSRGNVCGYKGVFVKPNGRYQARIVVKGVKYHLGHYDTAEEAHDAYVRAALKLHGNFANLKTATHKEYHHGP